MRGMYRGGGLIDAPLPTVERTIMAAAKRLDVRLAAHHVLMSRVGSAVGVASATVTAAEREEKLKGARETGLLKFFNREFRKRGEGAAAGRLGDGVRRMTLGVKPMVERPVPSLPLLRCLEGEGEADADSADMWAGAFLSAMAAKTEWARAVESEAGAPNSASPPKKTKRHNGSVNGRASSEATAARAAVACAHPRRRN